MFLDGGHMEVVIIRLRDNEGALTKLGTRISVQLSAGIKSIAIAAEDANIILPSVPSETFPAFDPEREWKVGDHVEWEWDNHTSNATEKPNGIILRFMGDNLVIGKKGYTGASWVIPADLPFLRPYADPDATESVVKPAVNVAQKLGTGTTVDHLIGCRRLTGVDFGKGESKTTKTILTDDQIAISDLAAKLATLQTEDLESIKEVIEKIWIRFEQDQDEEDLYRDKTAQLIDAQRIELERIRDEMNEHRVSDLQTHRHDAQSAVDLLDVVENQICFKVKKLARKLKDHIETTSESGGC
jgi:hypothetical protein